MGVGRIHHKNGRAAVYVDRRRVYLCAWDGKGDPPAEAVTKRNGLIERYGAGLPVHRDAVRASTVGVLVAEYLDTLRGATYNQQRALLKILVTVHAYTPIPDFGPVALDELRKHQIKSGRTRSGINKLASVIRNVFRFGVSRELVEPGQLVALGSLRPLMPGRTPAIESVPKGPARMEDIQRVLPCLKKRYQAMTRFQLATGCRPGEVCSMRWEWIDRSGPMWVARLPKHKTAFQGKHRLIPLNESARLEMLWRGEKSDGLIFGGQPQSWRSAILRAAERCGSGSWSPNQIRKLVATEIASEFDLEHARALLGHTSTAMTAKHYAETSLEKAKRVVDKKS